MKKFGLIVLFILSANVLFHPSPVLAQDNTHLKYFGYYWGMDGFAQMKSYVNTMVVSNEWKATAVPDLAALDIRDLTTLDANGAKGIVDISGIFFNLQNNTLWPDWEARFNQYWSLIYPHLSKIRAFYPCDEPDGVPAILSAYPQVVHLLKINIDTVTPKIPILMVVTASGAIRIKNADITVPADISWLGFDEYNCWGVECFAGISIADKFNGLVSVMRSRGGNVILIPDGMKSSTTPPTSAEQAAWVTRAQQYTDLCKNTPECIGMFPFLWDTVTSQGGMIGVNSMPVLEAKFHEIGQSIVGTPKPGDFNNDGSVNIFDYNELVANFGHPYTIFDYNTLVANFGLPAQAGK